MQESKNKLSLGILITTMNEGIERVIKELLPQLNLVDEIIISHQITDKKIKPLEKELGKKIKYYYMYDKGLSKNRNNALKYSTTDICYICDDDLNFKDGFVDKIKKTYSNIDGDIITFQTENENGKKHFNIKEGKHTKLSVLKIWSIGITFKRKSIINKKIFFDEKFGLGAKYSTGEDSIFLSDCYKKGLKMYHSDNIIVIHSDESSGIDYNRELIVARIKVFKRLFGFMGGFVGVFYFTVFHYKYYKGKFSIFNFLKFSFKGLFN